MKIAIFSANTGNGHKVAAQNLKKFFDSKGENTKIFSYEDYFPNSDKYYESGIKLKKIYGAIYFLMNQKFIKNFSNRILGNKKKFLNDLEDFGPDIIFNCANFLNKRENEYQKKSGCKIYSLITDGYTFPNTWIEKNIDGYFVIDDFTKSSFLKKNPNIQITTSFFPIEKKYFSNKKSIEKRKFWFLLSDLDKEIVQKTIDMVLKNYKSQIIIVGGRNKKDFKFFSSKYKNHKNFQFFEKINLIENFGKIDIFFGKPGGALMCECIANDTPLIVLEKLAIQEDGNVKILENYKLGIYSKNIFEIKNFIDNIDDEILPLFHNIKKDACKIIYEKICDERK